MNRTRSDHNQKLAGILTSCAKARLDGTVISETKTFTTWKKCGTLSPRSTTPPTPRRFLKEIDATSFKKGSTVAGMEWEFEKGTKKGSLGGDIPGDAQGKETLDRLACWRKRFMSCW